MTQTCCIDCLTKPCNELNCRDTRGVSWCHAPEREPDRDSCLGRCENYTDCHILKAKPKRIQRKRTKNWKIPENAVCRICGRLLEPDNMYPSRLARQDYICKFCLGERTGAWWSRLSPKERSQVYRRANLKRFGLSEEALETFLRKQDYKCAICKDKLGSSKLQNQFGSYDFTIDHDHSTNKVRGILCHQCNSMLGYARDNIAILRAGAEYLCL